jgi:hypothetical protein
VTRREREKGADARLHVHAASGLKEEKEMHRGSRKQKGAGSYGAWMGRLRCRGRCSFAASSHSARTYTNSFSETREVRPPVSRIVQVFLQDELAIG